MRIILTLIILLLSFSGYAEEQKPNIIIFYVDDLGYGDVGVYGATGVKTPNVDELAKGGVRFTDAHSTAATCTPSRYSLLTGEHGFRSKAEILDGDALALIKPGKPTIASMLKNKGYNTAVIGKWHLGFGDGAVDWNEAVKPGPLEVGFDYSFLIPATGDRVPTVYLENHHVINLDKSDPIKVSYKEKVGNRPTGLDRPDLLRVAADVQHSETIINGVSRIGTMSGGESALWVDENIPDILTDKAKSYIKENKDTPFFLFYSFHDIHVPRLPHKRFVGSSDMGPRGDAIVQVDWVVGEIVDELQKHNLSENTLIIFTSDNGPVLNDGYGDGAAEMLGEHKPAGPYRGGKYSAFEAGTRMPTITYWEGRISPKISNALISQVDIFASIASLVGVKLNDDEAMDSQDYLQAWFGKTDHAREYMIEETEGTLSLRWNDWKYIAPLLENEGTRDWIWTDKAIESGLSREVQLYNLAKDISEQNNLAENFPEIVNHMKQKLDSFVESGFQREKK